MCCTCAALVGQPGALRLRVSGNMRRPCFRGPMCLGTFAPPSTLFRVYRLQAVFARSSPRVLICVEALVQEMEPELAKGGLWRVRCCNHGCTLLLYIMTRSSSVRCCSNHCTLLLYIMTRFPSPRCCNHDWSLLLYTMTRFPAVRCCKHGCTWLLYVMTRSSLVPGWDLDKAFTCAVSSRQFASVCRTDSGKLGVRPSQAPLAIRWVGPQARLAQARTRPSQHALTGHKLETPFESILSALFLYM